MTTGELGLPMPKGLFDEIAGKYVEKKNLEHPFREDQLLDKALTYESINLC